MNRFVIVDGLPFLLANGKTYAVRWDEKGFTVGAEVKLASVPSVTHHEIAVKAKCAERLDSISVYAPEQAVGIDGMTIPELKEYAQANGIDLGEAKKKAEILEANKNADVKDVVE